VSANDNDRLVPVSADGHAGGNHEYWSYLEGALPNSIPLVFPTGAVVATPPLAREYALRRSPGFTRD
jgi:hypothetical protein